MNAGTVLDPQMIKNEDVSEKEYAAVSQQLSKLPGVNTSMDWDRKYPYGDTLRGIFGDVSTPRYSKRIDRTLLIQRIFTQ